MTEATIFLISLLIFCITVIIAKWIWIRRELFALSFKVPGLQPIPFFGNLPTMIKFLRKENKLDIFWELHEKFNGFYGVWMGPDFYLQIFDPEDMQSIFSVPMSEKPRGVMDWWSSAFGEGVLTTSAHSFPWRSHKRLVEPTLSTNAIKPYFGPLRKNSMYLIEDMKKLTNKGLVDIDMTICRFIADAVTEAFFGIQMDFRDGTKDELFLAIKSVSSGFMERITHYWYGIDFIYNLTNHKRSTEKSRAVIEKHMRNILKAKLKHDKNNASNGQQLATGEILIQAYQSGAMTEAEVVGEIANNWIAAADTTMVLLCFCVLTLAMNKEHQSRVVDELRAVYGNDKKRPVELEDLALLPYLEMCMKETIRFFSPGPLTARLCRKQFVMKSKNIVIPANTGFVFSSYLTHRHPKYWDRPEEFIPERFSTENCRKMHPFAFGLFSKGGVRKCPGRAYGYMILQTSLIYLLREFEFSSDWKIEELPLEFGINIESAWGYHVTVNDRKWD